MLSLFGGTSALAIISAAAWGLGYFGQPHIIVRFMAIRSVKDIPTARFIGLAWMGISLVGALAVGLIGRAWFSVHATPLTDPEIGRASCRARVCQYGYISGDAYPL